MSSDTELVSEQEAPLDFYLTPAHPCSYLDRSDAQTLFADPRRIITSARIHIALMSITLHCTRFSAIKTVGALPSKSATSKNLCLK